MRLDDLEREFEEKRAAEERRVDSLARLRYDPDKSHKDWRLCNDFCRAAGYCTGNGSAFCCAEMDN
jgi:hypothetical protein